VSSAIRLQEGPSRPEATACHCEPRSGLQRQSACRICIKMKDRTLNQMRVLFMKAMYQGRGRESWNGVTCMCWLDRRANCKAELSLYQQGLCCEFELCWRSRRPHHFRPSRTDTLTNYRHSYVLWPWHSHAWLARPITAVPSQIYLHV
jgi:hypothetical protein